jgi:hypothetical protein
VTTIKHCPRCDKDTPVDAPWPHWRRVRTAYIAFACVIMLLGPVLSADYCVMIPSAFIYMTAWGPLNGLVAERPTCRKCGGIAEGEPTEPSMPQGA